MDFRRPLGLMLSGGGAHGAWQEGCVQAMRAAGLTFDKVLGFSIGAVTGAAYAFGFQELFAESWRDIERHRLMRWQPRWHGMRSVPISLYSGDALDEALAPIRDEERNKRRACCELTIVSHRAVDRTLHYARFTPGGAGGWDGPVYERLRASCAIPWIFPPVLLDGEVFVDGGLPAREPMNFDALAGCADVIALQMVRPEELGRLRPWLRRGWDQVGREICGRQIAAGVELLRRRPDAPRVFRCFPSEVLDYHGLSFRTEHCAPAFELGRRDGEIFAAA